MAFSHRSRTVAASLLLTAASWLHAQPQARFDLVGPKIDVRVTRQGVALPIATVPNLLVGDKIWLHPDLPPTQSVHYLLIAVFLRGTTNPPPDGWFTRIETWDKKVRAEGVTITVPDEAQQAILFLAPETGGDFSTLRSAVKGRPGIFVRASQDLAEAGFEQARIETYLAALKQVPPADQTALQKHSDLLARTLNLKPNPDCFKRPLDQQYNCLTLTGNQTLLDDGHGQTIAAALANGPSSDLINQASYTQLAGAGVYSAYVGAIVDLVRLTSGLHTAQYQYIPAIAFPAGESLNLRLNTAPSFHNPKSVIVIGLPAVQKSVLPPLRAADPNHISCLLEPAMVLPVEGAPLVFSTAFAHDLVLHVDAPAGPAKDIPLAPDAFQGGLAVMPTTEPERHELPTVPVPGLNLPGAPEYKQPGGPPIPALAKPTPAPDTVVTGTVRGMWGFDSFTGPALPLQQLPGQGWRIVTTPQTPAVLIAGQPNHLQLTSTGTACIRSIAIEPGDAHADWKLAATKATDTSKSPTDATPVDLTVNLQHAAKPGNLQLAILQYGLQKPDQLGTKTFSEPARIEAVKVHAADTSVTLTGSSLDQVRQVAIDDFTFVPAPQSAADQPDTSAGKTSASLALALAFGMKQPPFKSGDRVTAHIALRDDRIIDVPVVVESARPEVAILSRRIAASPASPIKLASADEVPLGAQLVFFLKSQAKFSRNEQIEIANADESLHTDLTVAAGTLIMQDAHTVLATLDPLKTFGTSVFGPLHLRAVAGDGTGGDWLPLATVVRLPTLDQLHCAPDPAQPCVLTGSSLYLIDAVSSDPAFGQPSTVPEGYVDSTLNVPHPDASGILYLRLRDDPNATQQATLPIQPDGPSAPKHATNHGGPRTAKPSAPDPAPTDPSATSPKA